MLNHKTININIIIIFIILFIPKISLIPIPGYWQGIRSEDLLIFFSLFSLYQIRERLYVYNKSSIYISIFHYFLIILISEIIYSFYENTNLILFLRFLEYFVLLYLFEIEQISKKIVSKLLKYYLLVNLFTAILQYFKLIGSLTSLGYLGPNHFLNIHPMGITGGSWELGAISAIIFLIFTVIKKNNFELVFIFIISLSCAFLAAGRANFIGLVTSGFLYFAFISKISTRNKIFFLLIILSTFVLFYEFLLKLSFIQKIIYLDFNFIIDLLISTIAGIEIPKNDIPNPEVHLSIWYRMMEVRWVLEKLNSNPMLWVTGTGFGKIYTDTFYLRVIMSSGLIGVLYFFFLFFNIRLYILAFYLIAGAFLDLFMSMKIFCFTLLLIYVLKNLNEKNDFRKYF